MDLMGSSRDQSFAGQGGGPSRLLKQSDEGELAGGMDSYIEVELAFSGLDLSDVDVEIADRISFEVATFDPLGIDRYRSAESSDTG
jgi:hypothetical protein